MRKYRMFLTKSQQTEMVKNACQLLDYCYYCLLDKNKLTAIIMTVISLDDDYMKKFFIYFDQLWEQALEEEYYEYLAFFKNWRTSMINYLYAQIEMEVDL